MTSPPPEPFGGLRVMGVTIEDVFGEGDLVVDRCTAGGTHSGEPLFGVAASGRSIQVSGIHELASPAGASPWGVVDEVSLAQQLGLAPAGRRGRLYMTLRRQIGMIPL